MRLRSEEHTSELQSRVELVCRLLLEKKNNITRPGASTRVRSWTPTAQAQHGFMFTHTESISISDYFTLRENGNVVYLLFFFNDTATTEIYTLSLHDALPI